LQIARTLDIVFSVDYRLKEEKNEAQQKRKAQKMYQPGA